MISEYSPSEQVRSSVEGTLRPVLAGSGDEPAFAEYVGFLTPDANEAWMASLDAEACRAKPVRCEVAGTLSMDERAHPHERELRALIAAALDGDGASYHALLKKLTAN